MATVPKAPPPNPRSEPILDLSTEVTRHAITIDGKRYDLRVYDDISVADYHRLPRLSRRARGLMLQETLSTADALELTETVDTICRIVLDAPDEVQAKLKDTHRLRIFEVFTLLSRATPPPAPARAARPPSRRPAQAH